MKGPFGNGSGWRGETVTRDEFAQAIEQYGDMIFRLSYSCLKRREDAEDVMQETLLKLYRSDKPFESEAHRRFWLVRVAVNECRRAHRWYRRIVPLEELPETVAFDRSEERELFRQVMALPEKYRLTVYLFYYEGYSAREIASIMGTKESTVQTRLARARERLRQSLEEV